MMFLELALLLWIVAIGVIAMASLWPLGPIGMALASTPVGAAVYALSALALFAIDQFSTMGSLIVATLAAGILALFRYRSGHGARPATVRRASGFALAGALLVFFINAIGAFTRLTPDSIDYLTVAGAFERLGDFPDVSSTQIVKRQFVLPALHTGGVVTGLGYFTTLTTLVTVSGLGFMMWLGATSLRRTGVSLSRAVVAVALVGSFIVTTNRVAYNIFYLNSHGVFATLLVVAVGLTWYATVTGQWSMVALAGIAAAAIVPLRAEGIIVVTFFVLPFLVSPMTPRRARWAVTIPIAAVAIMWNGVILLRTLPADDFGLTSTPATSLIIAVGLVAISLLTYARVTAGLLRFAPALAFALLAIYTTLRFTRGVDAFSATMAAVGSNIAITGFWTSFWWIAPIVIAVGLATVRVAHQSRFMWGILSYPIALLAFMYIRGAPYRVGAGDSANRMLMHVVFVIGLYLIVVVGHLAARIDDDHWNLRTTVRRAVDSITVR